MSTAGRWFLAASATVGCSRGLPTQFVGSYKGTWNQGANDRSLPGRQSDAEASLVLRADGTFKMLLVVNPIEGRWEAAGETLSLKVEKFGDRTLDQLRKEIPKTASMCDQPLKLTASGGGTLTEASIFGPGGGYWVFTKEKK